MAAEHQRRFHVVDKHRDLHDFEGEWHVIQQMWTEPNEKPLVNRGRAEYHSILGGLAALKRLELDGDSGHFAGVGIFTWNPNQARYEAVWLDSYSHNGFTAMTGKTDRAPSRANLAELLPGGPVRGGEQLRQWAMSVSVGGCISPDNVLFAVNPAAGTEHARKGGVDQNVVRLVENKISDDHWVLEFYANTPGGADLLIQQNSYTR